MDGDREPEAVQDTVACCSVARTRDLSCNATGAGGLGQIELITRPRRRLFKAAWESREGGLAGTDPLRLFDFGDVFEGVAHEEGLANGVAGRASSSCFSQYQMRNGGSGFMDGN